MKKSLFVAIISAILLFCSVTADAAEKPGAATKQAAVEKLVDAIAGGNIDKLWAILPDSLRAGCTVQAGSEKDAKELLKQLMTNDPRTVSRYKMIKHSPDAKKRMQELIELKKAFIKTDGRYYIDLTKLKD